MSETSIAVTPGSGVNVGGYLDSAGFFRQVVILGDDTGNLAKPDSNGNLPTRIVYQTQAPTTVTWNSATAINTASTVTMTGEGTALITAVVTGTITGGQLTFEGYDGTNWWALNAMAGTGLPVSLASTYTLATGGAQYWNTDVIAFQQVRVRLSTVVSGSGSVTVTVVPIAANNDVFQAVGQYSNGSLVVTNGGTTTTPIAAGATGPVVIKASSGRLSKVLVTTTGTAGMKFYDNASAASGTIIGVVPANAAAGTIYELHLPAANGITADAGTNCPAVTVSYV